MIKETRSGEKDGARKRRRDRTKDKNEELLQIRRAQGKLMKPKNRIQDNDKLRFRCVKSKKIGLER
jgi:hypothetical protein